MELDINDLRKICSAGNIEITLHAAKRLEQRHISLKDIISGIKTGMIIEQYPNDYPFPSCLILGLDIRETAIHLVIGTDLETLWVVTAYYPDPQKWKDDLQTRKES